METFWYRVGVVAAVAMPLWNIPLIVRIIRRKTSQDISLLWVFGIWGCILLMLPSALQSHELQLRAFGISNVVFFSAVVATVLWYRRGDK